MFSSKHVPAYLDDLSFRIWKDKSGDEHKLVDLALRVEPLTTALAGEIHTDVKGALFRRSSGEINDRLSRVAFNIPIKPQSVAFRGDRKMSPSFEAEEVKVSRLVARSRPRRSRSQNARFPQPARRRRTRAAPRGSARS